MADCNDCNDCDGTGSACNACNAGIMDCNCGPDQEPTMCDRCSGTGMDQSDRSTAKPRADLAKILGDAIKAGRAQFGK